MEFLKKMGEYKNIMTYGEDRTSTEIFTSFKLTKNIRFKNERELRAMIKKLDKLKNEKFNRVLIPNFDYSIKIDKSRTYASDDDALDHFLIYNVDFIKGYPVGTVTEPFASIVKEDIVERDSDWTFSDYHMTNFIVEAQTDKLYAVDFQSYSYIPDKNLRWETWNNCQNTHKKIFQGIVNNKWQKPSILYTH